jgi:hypothetical protein
LTEFDGKLYVGGIFEDANGITDADYLAVWNGTEWSSIGGLSSSVRSLTEFDGKLYVGGVFEDANGITDANKLVAFDGDWNVVKDAIFFSPTDDYFGDGPVVYAMTIFDTGDVNQLIVGGYFKDVNSIPDTNFIAVFTTTSESGEPPAPNSVPTMDGIDLNEASAIEGQTINVSVINPIDTDLDTLAFYCSTTTGASSSQKDFCDSTGNTFPYTISCDGVGAAGQGTQTIYCVLDDGTVTTSEFTDTYEAVNPIVYGKGWTKYDELQQQNFLTFWAEFAGALAVMLIAFVLIQFGFKGR